MEKFIHMHMTSILKPIAEHIDQLLKGAEQLSNALGENKVRLDNNQRRIGEAETQLTATLEDVSQLKADGKKVHDEVILGGLVKRLGSLEVVCQAAREATDKLEMRADGQGSALQALQLSQDNATANLNRLQLKHWQTTNLAQRVESSLAELKDEQADLTERHVGLARGLQQTQQVLDAHRLSVAKLASNSEATQKEAQAAFRSLAERMNVSDKLLGRLEQAVHLHGKELGSTGNELKQLGRDMGALGEAMEGSKDGLDNVQTLRQRLLDMEASVNDIRKKTSAEADRNLFGMLRELTRAVQTSTATIHENENSLHTLEASHKGHRDRIAGIEARSAEAVIEREDHLKRLVAAEDDIGRLQAIQRDAEGKLNLQKCELDKARAAQLQTSRELSEAQNAVQNLHGEHGMTCEGMAKMASRLDLAHEYLHGLGKGFQETHRIVLAGQDGMVAPRAGSVAGQAHAQLPALIAPQPRMASALLRGRYAPSATPR